MNKTFIILCLFLLISSLCVNNELSISRGKQGLYNICTLQSHSPNSSLPIVSEYQPPKDVHDDTISAQTYIIVLLITLPLITVALIIIVPTKTNALLVQNSKQKKKDKNTNKIIKDDENL